MTKEELKAKAYFAAHQELSYPERGRAPVYNIEDWVSGYMCGLEAQAISESGSLNFFQRMRAFIEEVDAEGEENVRRKEEILKEVEKRIPPEY